MSLQKMLLNWTAIYVFILISCLIVSVYIHFIEEWNAVSHNYCFWELTTLSTCIKLKICIVHWIYNYDYNIYFELIVLFVALFMNSVMRV